MIAGCFHAGWARNPTIRLPVKKAPSVPCHNLYPPPSIGSLVTNSEVEGTQAHLADLLNAWALVAQRSPDWKLMIVGEGEERHALEALRDQLGLRTNAMLPGAFSDITEAYEHASIFCFFSRYEGFGLVRSKPCCLACRSFRRLTRMVHVNCRRANGMRSWLPLMIIWRLPMPYSV